MKSKYILIFGVPGVGKSSVIREARKYIDFEVVNFGDIMVEITKIPRDEIRFKLSEKDMRKYQKEAIKYIKKNYKGIVLIDTHGILLSEYELKFGFPKELIKTLKPAATITITADDFEIAKRRKEDSGKRMRGVGLEKDIEMHQNLEITFGMLLAYLYNIPQYIIHNEQGKLKESGRILSQIIRSVVK
jgi:adenylate kinase